jgi:hypothetical protein
MSIAPVSGGGPSGEPSRAEPDRWPVQPGDTLCGIARTLQQQGMAGSVASLVRELVRLNGLPDPDRIEVGQLLRLPVRPLATTGSEPSTDRMEMAPPSTALPPAPLRAEERRELLERALFRLRAGQPGHPESVSPGVAAGAPSVPELRRAPDGTPLFRQGDPAWRAERLGVDGAGPTLAHAGCAITACAMALSRVSGQVLTPDVLLRHLREQGGFQGALVDWSRAGPAAGGGTRAAPADLDRSTLDRELDAGRPVLLRVLHDLEGVPRQHWICLTGRDRASGRYTANDPATGRTTALVSSGEGLVTVAGEPVPYASNARMVTFAPGSGGRTG